MIQHPYRRSLEYLSRFLPSVAPKKTQMPMPVDSNVTKMPKRVIQQIRKNAKQGFKVENQAVNCSGIRESGKIDRFQCRICCSHKPKTQAKGIGKCKHIFCSDCLNQYTVYKIGRFQAVTCPDTGCPEPIDQKSQCFKNLPHKVVQKYRKFKRYEKVLKQPNIRMCPKQACQGFINMKHFEKTKKKQYTVANPRCDKCMTIYCYKCMLGYHEGSCEDSELEYFRKTLGYGQCSRCKRVIQKTNGCNHMQCPCGYHFCYRCGEKYVTSYHKCLQIAQPANQQPLRPNLVQNDCQDFCECMYSFFCCKCNPTIQDLCSRPFFRCVYVLFWVLTIMPFTYIQLALFFIGRVMITSLFIGTFGLYCTYQKFRQDNNFTHKWWLIVLAVILLPLTLIAGVVVAMYQECQEEKVRMRYVFRFPCENLGNVWTLGA